ncbi:MAG TPA: ABC transporter ATP-binding protein [Syntrophomonadaceae bacterium]|nr:ABC transporter ATP-binding protein [Syntrophomonadaceae bacterium]
MPLVEARNISFGYDQENVFQDISFQVGKGEVFFLLGPNGCGKTTLLDCVLGLLKPRTGDILINGTGINDIRTEALARQIAYVPQSHEKTFPYKVIDIVLMGRASYIGLFSAPTEQDVAVAEESLKLVGISKLRDRRYTQISGGEGQLVMIARALAQKTPLIVMDEPTAHLDFKHELVIMERIVELVKVTGLTVLMATHFPNHAFYFENNDITTRVALMNEGRFLAVDAPSRVLSEDNLKLLYNINARVVSYDVNGNNGFKQVIPLSTINTAQSDDRRG